MCITSERQAPVERYTVRRSLLFIPGYTFSEFRLNAKQETELTKLEVCEVNVPQLGR